MPTLYLKDQRRSMSPQMIAILERRKTTDPDPRIEQTRQEVGITPYPFPENGSREVDAIPVPGNRQDSA
jgi:hypothetical protein